MSEYDFVMARTADGRSFRILPILDEYKIFTLRGTMMYNNENPISNYDFIHLIVFNKILVYYQTGYA